MDKLVQRLEKFISLLTSAAMAGIVVIVFMNVIMRYLFDSGLTWSDEVSVDLFVWFIFLGGILAELYGLHLKVDVFIDRMRPAWQRICAIAADLLVVVAMLILFVGGVQQVEIASKNISSATGLPSSYIVVSMVIFAGAVIVLTIGDLWKIMTGRKTFEEGDAV